MADELLLVKPFMPVGGQCLLYGKRGLGKTQLAHTLAIDVALGQPFLGMFETVQCNVVYVQADIPPALQKDRYSRIVKHLSLDKQFPLWYLISPGSFDTLDAIGNEASWIEDLRAVSPGLVIIDTLRKAHRMDENLSSTVVDVYAAWRYICGPDATILYIHHDRKSFDGGSSDEDFRGSGAWLDEADLGMHMRSSRTGLTLEWSKVRTCSEDDVRPVGLRMDADSLLMIPDDPVEAFIKDAMMRNVPKAVIAAAATDTKRWGSQALGKTTAYRRLESYDGDQIGRGRPRRIANNEDES